MPRILARLVLAISVVLAAPIVYFILFLIFGGLRRGNGTANLLLSTVGAMLFFIPAWIGVWRGDISWTRARRLLTVLSVLWCVCLSSAIGLALSSFVRYGGEELAIIMGGMTWLPAWMASTALVWRETSAERGCRLTRLGTGRVSCPECDYDLTGLREARCPECGTQYTLNQLLAVAMQSSHPIHHENT